MADVTPRGVGMLTMAVIRHTVLMDELDRPLHGEGYEEFIASIYALAVRLGRPTRAQIKDAVQGIDERDVDHALAELTARGFLRREDDEGRLSLVPPRTAIARYAELTEMRLRMARATAPELESAWRRALGRGGQEGVPGLDLLMGVADITSRISAMHLAARERLWWAIDGSAASRALLDRAADDPSILAVRDGVAHRMMFDTALLDVPSAVEVLERATADGVPVRMGNGIPISAVVCDDDAALVDVSAFDPDGAGSFETSVAGTVAAVANVLGRTWLLAAPYAPMVEATRRREEGGSSAPLDDRDHGILALLASGASDQAIARRHGVSVRTVERRVRYIMEHLGAATRFHAGAQAVRRGWV